MAMRSNGSMDSLNSSNSTSNQTKLDESDKDIIEMLEDPMGLERVVFNAINEGDRDTLIRVFEKHPNPTTILQMLLTTSYPNRDGFYKHDADVLQAAHELLGQSLEQLSAIQIACILGDEEIAIDILEFVKKITDEIEARKILYEFISRVWGDGNTTLHLASFLGMSDLVSKLLEYGAGAGKLNDKKYKPVDCADDEVTRSVFETFAKSPAGVSLPIPSPGQRSLKSSLNSLDDASSIDSSSDTLSKKPTEAQQQKRKFVRSNTASSDKFVFADLSRSPSSSDLIKDNDAESHLKKKKKKCVQFDIHTLILYMCQNDEEDNLQKLEALIKTSKTSEKQINLNQIYSAQQHFTPLHVACSHGAAKIVELFLKEFNVCVNVRDREGWTPLHCASAEGHLEILRLLGRCQGNIVDSNAKLFASDAPIFYTIDGPIVQMPQNYDGDNPIDTALEEKADEIASFFADLSSKYPPNIQIEDAFNKLDLIGDGEEEEDYDEDEIIDDNQVKEQASNRKNSGTYEKMATGISRAPSIMKSSFRHKHNEDTKKDVLSIDIVSQPLVASSPIESTAKTNLEPLSSDSTITADSNPSLNDTSEKKNTIVLHMEALVVDSPQHQTVKNSKTVNVIEDPPKMAHQQSSNNTELIEKDQETPKLSLSEHSSPEGSNTMKRLKEMFDKSSSKLPSAPSLIPIPQRSPDRKTSVPTNRLTPTPPKPRETTPCSPRSSISNINTSPQRKVTNQRHSITRPHQISNAQCDAAADLAHRNSKTSGGSTAVAEIETKSVDALRRTFSGKCDVSESSGTLKRLGGFEGQTSFVSPRKQSFKKYPVATSNIPTPKPKSSGKSVKDFIKTFENKI